MRLSLIAFLLMLAAGAVDAACSQFQRHRPGRRATPSRPRSPPSPPPSGDKKITAFTDENGRYSLSLSTPAHWDVQVEMFEFTTAKIQITAGDFPRSFR